ncbi:MAG: DUF4330 domain-containing protein [Firmicutes bacterium]|nr:DUF4330 domain-containing protein [Bacillota bacterium]
MTLIDSRGRLFGKVNIIDLLLVVLVLVGAYGFWHTRTSSAGLAALRGTERQIEATFLVSSVRPATSDVMKVGDKVNDGKTNSYLGVITDVRIEPAEIAMIMPDGRVYESVSKTRRDVWVTLRGPGRVSPNAIILGSTEIRIGTQVSLKTNIFAVQTTVMAIKVLD